MYEMYKDYEDRIDTLNLTIEELENELKKFSIIINEKDYQIKQLMEENSRLQAQLQNKIVYRGPDPTSPPRIDPVGPPAYDVRVNITPDHIKHPGLTPVLKVQSNPINTSHPVSIPRVKPLKSHVPQEKQQYQLKTSKGTLKRICPHCGAMGFAIKEVDDKNKIISYVPRRIYAKKRVCTKCFYEF
ncbi:MAG: hypothetical protein ACFFBP_06865 [Promethearchaeota archaeon]